VGRVSPQRRHAVVAAAVLVPALAYELVEVAQGDDGWPYSRYMRLMPPAAFTATLALTGGVLWTHIVKPLARRTVDAIATAVEALDDARAETEET
jgi:hypothetical protein